MRTRSKVIVFSGICILGALLLFRSLLARQQHSSKGQSQEDAVLALEYQASSPTSQPKAVGENRATFPAPPLTITPQPTSIPTFETKPAQETDLLIIGASVQERPITAMRFGQGQLKVVVVGSGLLSAVLTDHFRANQDDIPSNVTLWLINNPNPDRPAGEPTNMNGVRPLHNADTMLDACSENDWIVGPDNGPFPFSEPETQAVREFLEDAWMAVFFDPDVDAIRPAGCGHLPSETLASVFSAATNLSTSSSPVLHGYFPDYLAGGGAAAISIPTSGPEPASVLNGLRAALSDLKRVVAAELIDPTDFFWLEDTDIGRWRFPEGTFSHPLAAEQIGEVVYVLDAGRVIAIQSEESEIPEVILAPGREVEGVRVVEPLDLTSDGESLLVLERAGDVYRYKPEDNKWLLDRYERPVSETSAHYYVAMENRLLLETDYFLAVWYGLEPVGFTWRLRDDHQIDVTSVGDDLYILSRPPGSKVAALKLYRYGIEVEDFRPQLTLVQPRQIQAVGDVIYVLDQAGRRLSSIDSATGDLLEVLRFQDRAAADTIGVAGGSQDLILVGKDTIYLWDLPYETTLHDGSFAAEAPSMLGPDILDSLRGLSMPISGSNLPIRDNQLPGAPRHYRLGIHEGLDLYWESGTAVRAVADGQVIRADHNYVQPESSEFDAWRAQVQTLGYTTPEAHDFYRGRQVWIAHANSIVTRYVHLRAIDLAVEEGGIVQAGQIIGIVGNSGSPVSLESSEADAHLHLEIRFQEAFLGQFLRPIEIRELLEVILL